MRPEVGAVEKLQSVPGTKSQLEKIAVDASLLAAGELRHDVTATLDREIKSGLALHIKEQLPKVMTAAVSDAAYETTAKRIRDVSADQISTLVKQLLPGLVDGIVKQIHVKLADSSAAA